MRRVLGLLVLLCAPIALDACHRGPSGASCRTACLRLMDRFGREREAIGKGPDTPSRLLVSDEAEARTLVETCVDVCVEAGSDALVSCLEAARTVEDEARCMPDGGSAPARIR